MSVFNNINLIYKKAILISLEKEKGTSLLLFNYEHFLICDHPCKYADNLTWPYQGLVPFPDNCPWTIIYV
ncbi:hypothetical protein BpHYR1_006418 [Brachionus plicatilis]|uniref:Uncharacterized protein n=1 Tax=Brachionus plicatilis TaxID=10195 RepID=A0A3M7QWV9_BRAPC|nr:hypothetical protein BpHYR1_006418 [Brachionus plicatilis]